MAAKWTAEMNARFAPDLRILFLTVILIACTNARGPRWAGIKRPLGDCYFDLCASRLQWTAAYSEVA